MEKAAREAQREEQRVLWAGRIAAQRESGKSIKAFCAETGLRVWQFHYWNGVLRPKAGGPSGFVEVRVKGQGGVAIEVGGCRVCVEQGFDEGLLRAVVAALRVA